MRRAILAMVASYALVGAFPAKAGETERIRAERQQAYDSFNPWSVWNPGKQTYNRAYGYSTGYRGRGNYYGNSAPFQGNIRFAPGFGYGSIYGNSGHPGFHTFTGPAWNHPAAWGR